MQSLLKFRYRSIVHFLINVKIEISEFYAVDQFDKNLTKIINIDFCIKIQTPFSTR
mgnify:FL=1